MSVMSSSKRSAHKETPVPPAGIQERRSVCRYAVVQDAAWLGWWEGQAFQNTTAKIIDISLRGALLTVETFPPKDRVLWFCPPGTSANEEWIEVKLIGSKKKLFGPREVRIAFRKVFPYEIFKAVVYGQEALQHTSLPKWLHEETDDRDWW
jgi:hypothetical protein